MSRTSAAGPLPRGYELLWEHMHELSPGRPGQSRFTALLTRGFTGDLDVAAFRGALADVTRRHEMLRMRFRNTELDPLVEIVADVPAHLQVDDLRSLPPDERHDQMGHLLYVDSVRAFDVCAPPLWRARLVRVTSTYSIFCLSFPDLLFDAWSDKILIQDLMACYGARLGISAFPPPVTYGYHDLLRLHERQYGGIGARVKELAARLDPFPPMLPVPALRPAASDLLIDPVSLKFCIPPAVAARVNTCARRLRTTTYVVLLAAYHLLFAGLTRSSRITVSTVTLGRQSKAERAIVGQFGQDVFVPVDIVRREYLEDFLGRVHSSVMEARTARTSYRNLLSLLHRDPGIRPWSHLHLFDSYFQSVVPPATMPMPGPLRVDDAPDVVPRPLPEGSGYPTFDEVPPEAMPAWCKQGAPWLLIDEDRRGGAMVFNRTFFAESLAADLVSAYLDVLTRMTAASGEPVGKVSDL